MFSHTIILVWRKLGINKGKSNKEHCVTKQCYVTRYGNKQLARATWHWHAKRSMPA